MKRLGAIILMPAVVALPASVILSALMLHYGYMLVHGSAFLLFFLAPFFSMTEGHVNGVPIATMIWFFLFQYLYYVVLLLVLRLLARRIKSQSLE